MSLEEVREILDGNTSAEIEDRLRFTHRGILLRTGWTPETGEWANMQPHSLYNVGSSPETGEYFYFSL